MTGAKKILLIDESRTFVMYIGLLLKRMGFEVIPAGGAIEGLKLLNALTPDLVMSDLHMQDVDGFELLKELKGYERTAAVPVIIASVDASPESVERCFAAGCADYLPKPVTVERLHRAINGVITFRNGKKRENLRTSLRRKVTVDCAGEREALYVVCLSEGGMYLRRRAPLPIGSTMTVELPLENGNAVTLQGTVIYNREVFQNAFQVEPGVAIRFDPLPDNDAALLKQHITELLAGDILEEQDGTVLSAGFDTGGIHGVPVA